MEVNEKAAAASIAAQASVVLSRNALKWHISPPPQMGAVMGVYFVMIPMAAGQARPRDEARKGANQACQWDLP